MVSGTGREKREDSAPIGTPTAIRPADGKSSGPPAAGTAERTGFKLISNEV